MSKPVRFWWLLLSPLILLAGVTAQSAFAQGRIDLSLTISPFNHEVRAGQENRLFLEVRNTGTENLTNIRFSSDAPEGWRVEFRPGEIERLAARGVRTIDIIVVPEPRAPRSGQSITIIAEADEIKKVTSIFLSVKSSSFWPWLGAAIGVIVAAIFIFVFVRLGRQ